MAEVIQPASMGEAVYQEPTVVGLHQFGLAASVGGTFQRIGQRLADKLVKISKYACDWHYPQVIEVEVDIRQKYTTVPRRDQSERRRDRHAALF